MDLNNLPEETQTQLDLIDKSLFYILLTLGAIALSFYTTYKERERFVAYIEGDTTTEYCDLFPIRLTSNYMIIIALIFFFILAKNISSKPTGDCRQDNINSINTLCSYLVLLVALIRTFVLIDQHENNQTETLAEEIDIPFSIS